MPKGDRRGPMGQGSMTGRGLGFCQGYDTPGFTKNMGNGAGMGRGMAYGWGFGGGRGFGRRLGRGQGFGPGNFAGTEGMQSQSMSPKDEARMLRSQAEELKNSLQDIESRINDLENNAG